MQYHPHVPVPAATDRTFVCRLGAVHPPDLAFAIDLGDASLVLGRQAERRDERALSHRTVSRRHLEITWDAALARHYVRDLESRNGTWLAGQPLTGVPRVLEDNAVLRLGDVVLVYERRRGPVVDAAAVDRDAVFGRALAQVALRGAIARAAPAPAPILLLGERGAGKERVAAELHRLSGRSGPFVAFNCAALSPGLVGSQLFGHQRGASTDVATGHPGLFRAAAGGTLFLDEIGELPLDLQPRLLRAIELGELLPLDSAGSQRVDVRVVAATHRDLARDVDAGRFRRDLHTRLALWQLDVPGLAARRLDILAWLDRLARAWAAERGRPTPSIDLGPAAAERLVRHRWPENLRGLVRLIHDLAHLRGRGSLGPGDLPAWLDEPGEPPPARGGDDLSSRPSLCPRPTRGELLAALARHGWDIAATARWYDRDRKQVSRWIAMYAIELPDQGPA
nr:sigma 54-interacting transcriptional regulator [Nannocystis sp. SCPEA4]